MANRVNLFVKICNLHLLSRNHSGLRVLLVLACLVGGGPLASSYLHALGFDNGLKFDGACDLVELGSDSVFRDHLTDDALGFAGVDVQELAQLGERYVYVDLAQHQDVVLQQGFRVL